MVPIDGSLRGRLPSTLVPAIAWVCLVVLPPASVSAQDPTGVGVRAGAGVDGRGYVVYDAQIDLVDLSGSRAVAVGLRGFGEAFTSRSVRVSRTRHDYEELWVSGVGLTAELLLRHAPDARGPYLALGLGVGPLWVRWRLDSTSPNVGDPLPVGGSFLEEEGVTVGSMLSAGLGQRVYRSLHVRAQVTAVLVPSTDRREDLALVPFFTLTTGVRP